MFPPQNLEDFWSQLRFCHLSVAILYMSLSPSSLQSLTPVYHCALRFIGWSHLTHHCELYSRAGEPSLNIGWYTHWMTLVSKALFGPLHFYLFIHFSSEIRHHLCLMLKVHSMLFVWEQKRRRKLLASPRPLLASWAKTVRTCFIERFRQNLKKQNKNDNGNPVNTACVSNLKFPLPLHFKLLLSQLLYFIVKLFTLYIFLMTFTAVYLS